MTQLANYSTENFRSFSMSNLVTMPTLGDNKRLPISYTLILKDQEEDNRKRKLFQKYKSLEDVRKMDFYQYVKEKISLDKRAYTPEFRSFSSKSCINYDESLKDDTFLRGKRRSPSPYDFNIIEPCVTSLSHSIPEEGRVVSSPLVSTIIEESEYSSKTKDSRSPSECTIHTRYSCDELDCANSTNNQIHTTEILWDKSFNLMDINTQQEGLESSYTPINRHYIEDHTKYESNDAAICSKHEETKKLNTINNSPEEVKLNPTRSSPPHLNPVSTRKSPENITTKESGEHKVLPNETGLKRSVKKIGVPASSLKTTSTKALPSSLTPKNKEYIFDKSDSKKECNPDKIVERQAKPQATIQAQFLKDPRRRNLSFSSRTTSKSGSLNAKLTKSPRPKTKQETTKHAKPISNLKLSQKSKPLPRSKSSGSDIIKKRVDAKTHFNSPIKQSTKVANKDQDFKSLKMDNHHVTSTNVYLNYPKQPTVKSIKECLNFDQEKFPIVAEILDEGQIMPDESQNNHHPMNNSSVQKISEGLFICNETMCDVSYPSSNLSTTHTDKEYSSIKEKSSKDHIMELIRRMSNNVMKKPTDYILSLYKPTMDSPSKVRNENTDVNVNGNEGQKILIPEKPIYPKDSGKHDVANKSEYKISFVATQPKTSASDDKKLFAFIKRKLKVDHIKAQLDGSAIESEHKNRNDDAYEIAKNSVDSSYSDVADTETNFCSLHIPCFPERRSLKYNRAPNKSNGQAASYRKIKEKLSKDHLMSPTRLMASIQNGEIKTEYQKSFGMVPDNDSINVPKASRALYMQNRDKALLDHIKILCENDIAFKCSGHLENVSSKSKSENNISEYKSSFMNIDNTPKRPYKTPSSAILFP